MDRLLRMPQVVDTVGLKRSTIYLHIRLGSFPPPVKVGRTSGWRESAIQKWIDSHDKTDESCE